MNTNTAPCERVKARSTMATVAILKADNCDFEFYPTTDEIISVIKNDIDNCESFSHQSPSILDCGGGDGRVLKALTKGKRYCIEKAKPLLAMLDNSIFVVGTDFDSQTLIDKNVSIIVSNPPYLVYERWSTKIITEANARYVYLVIPKRWSKSRMISEAIESRNADVEVLGDFDFSDAERKARVNVQVVKVTYGYSRDSDAFSIWFNEHFKLQISNTSPSHYASELSKANGLNDRVEAEMVEGGNLVETLERLYQNEMNNLMSTYLKVADIPAELLNELEVNIEGLKEALMLKINSLKDRYWRELFNNFTKITALLTCASRDRLLKTLTDNTHVDFTVENCSAVIGWVIKNASSYYESQLTTTYERMISNVNIINYVSNQRTWEKNEWRYSRKPADLERYSLELRCIVEMGGISRDWKGVVSLERYGADFLDDLVSVAGTLGYNIDETIPSARLDWNASNKHVYYYRESDGTDKTLFDVKAYFNGNIHVRFSPHFILKFNTEHGRLSGWLRSKKEAVDELSNTGVSVDVGVIEKAFGSTLQINSMDYLRLN